MSDATEPFRTAFIAAAVGMAQFSADGCWLQVNPRLCALAGRTEATCVYRM